MTQIPVQKSDRPKCTHRMMSVDSLVLHALENLHSYHLQSVNKLKTVQHARCASHECRFSYAISDLMNHITAPKRLINRRALIPGFALVFE